ncbi:MAG: hypothetical protein AABY32_01805 [Nanoarchaeota archaeon]
MSASCEIGVSVKTKCNSCNGTGIFTANGIDGICRMCNGSGCVVINYEPFISRENKDNCKFVKLSDGSVISYKKFKNTFYSIAGSVYLKNKIDIEHLSSVESALKLK